MQGAQHGSVLDQLPKHILTTAASMPVPSTSQDVKVACKRLKQSPAELADYLSRIPPVTYKKLMKSDLDADTLQCFANALKERSGTDPDWGRASLAALKQVDRFTMLSLMTPGIKATLSQVESRLKAGKA